MAGDRRERSDARRNRATIVAAARVRLARGGDLSMRAVASAAGVSRSTLYRHFPRREDLDQALIEEALAEAHRLASSAGSDSAPALLLLRRLVDGLVELGAGYRIDTRRALADPAANAVVAALLPLAHRLGRAAGIDSTPPDDWLQDAGHHFLEACLDLGARTEEDRGVAAETLFAVLTESLDRGLVLLDAEGLLLGLNSSAARALDPTRRPELGQRLTAPRLEVTYEDGFPSSPESYPLSEVLHGAKARVAGVRGHRQPTGELTWLVVDARLLRRPGADVAYGVVGVLSDVTAEKAWELERLRPPGQLGRARPVPLDITRALDEIPPHLFPEQFVSEARGVTGAPVALYVLDIDGSHLLRLAGADEFPARLEAPLALGPELAQDGLPDLRARLESELPGVEMAPMWVRGRAIGLLLGLRASKESLVELAWHGAAAMELARGYTDVFDAAQRRKKTAAAAEFQQSLVPPRIARIGGGELAGSILPAYEVGGDWFDYVENRDGAWLAIADAVGKENEAAALAAVTIGALRASRRAGGELEGTVAAMRDAIATAGHGRLAFLTAVVALWSPTTHRLRWITAGHPRPIVLRSGGDVETLGAGVIRPLGLGGRDGALQAAESALSAGDRLVLYSDGLVEQQVRGTGTRVGIDAVHRVVRESADVSCAQMVRRLQDLVVEASDGKLRDDASLLALAVDRAPGSSPSG